MPRLSPFRRRGHVVLLALLAAALLAPAGAHAAPGDNLGVYPGAGDVGHFGGFERTVGRKLARGHDFLDKTSWDTMLDVRWLAEKWTSAGMARKMVITVPMFPNSEPDASLASGASGKFNGYFRTLAQNLVGHGLGSSVLRIGHEFNGTWFKWSMGVPNGAADYAEYWRQIVTTMRSVSGANFTFDWSPNADSSWVNGVQLQAADAWPGIGYVDYVGLDVYDQSWIANYQDPVARWNQFVSQPNGLAWQAAFAASKGKPITFPEWALVADRADGHGGGDDPYFVQQMYNWIQSHNVAYHLYFDFKDGEAQYGLFSGRFPNAARTFVKLFGYGSLTPAAASSFDIAEFARLCIDHARISPRARRLKLRATIARSASGAARVELSAGGRKTQFSKTITGGRVNVSRKLSRKQARKGTGIVTISYGGNAQTKPQQVRLRVAPRKARLRLRIAPSLRDGSLKTNGTINRRARGTVHVQLKYDVAGRTVTREYRAKIRRGRWRLDAPISNTVRNEIAARTSGVHAYALYAGSLPRRIGGQMETYELLGPT
jgi:Glycosyl hydrolase family 26